MIVTMNGRIDIADHDVTKPPNGCLQLFSRMTKNENPPKSLTAGDNQLSIVGFNLK